jgi:hypothetical protein
MSKSFQIAYIICTVIFFIKYNVEPFIEHKDYFEKYSKIFANKFTLIANLILGIIVSAFSAFIFPIMEIWRGTNHYQQFKKKYESKIFDQDG